jgi:hypothetical protein
MKMVPVWERNCLNPPRRIVVGSLIGTSAGLDEQVSEPGEEVARSCRNELRGRLPYSCSDMRRTGHFNLRPPRRAGRTALS